jgi:hypothetical protein
MNTDFKRSTDEPKIVEVERADSVFADKTQERDPKLDEWKQEHESTRKELGKKLGTYDYSEEEINQEFPETTESAENQQQQSIEQSETDSNQTDNVLQ